MFTQSDQLWTKLSKLQISVVPFLNLLTVDKGDCGEKEDGISQFQFLIGITTLLSVTNIS